MKHSGLRRTAAALGVVALLAALVIRLAAATSMNVVFIGAAGGNGILFLDQSPVCAQAGATSQNANDDILIGGSTACLPVTDNPANPAMGLAAFTLSMLSFHKHL